MTFVLDHGYVECVETWGSDEQVIRSARMSTDKGFLGWGPVCATCGGALVTDGPEPFCLACGEVVEVKPGDEKLLRFLWEKKHSTPFEFGGLTIETQAPLIVFREWHRHRVPFGYSELSARYTPMPDIHYRPTVARIVNGAAAAGRNKQARGASDVVIDDPHAARWLVMLDEFYAHSQRVYDAGLAMGVPKEVARLAVSVGRYSRMQATGNLRGWLGFLGLRTAKDAQWEIRQFANVVHDILVEHFPRTLALFDEGRA